MKFSELNLQDELQAAVKKAGFEETTPIQADTIPLVLEGKDVVGQAQTGTGKTAAFGLPILNNVDLNNPDVSALIISPTRELAAQTKDEMTRLGYEKKVKTQVVFGGSDIRSQINGMKRHPSVVVGTPGRIIDLINRHVLKLNNLKTLVLDEADEMLDMGFLEDIEKILQATPNSRQTLLFSATMPKAIMRISAQFMTDPITVKIKSKELTTDLVEQFYVRSRDFEKFDNMTKTLDSLDPNLTIIFGRTKRRVDELTRGLITRGYEAEGIHGDLTQQKRTQVLKDFKNDRLRILVATDVAARGLDISNVDLVVNYDIPQDPESYVHRIGRTGRAGRRGQSVTFVSNNEMGYLEEIEKLTRKRMLPMRPPTDEEAVLGRIKKAFEDIKEKISDDSLNIFDEAAEELVAQFDTKDLAKVLLSSVTNQDQANAKVKISPERPLPNKNRRGGGNGNRNSKYGRNGGNNRNRGGNRNSDRRRSSNRSDSSRKTTKKRNFKIKEAK